MDVKEKLTPALDGNLRFSLWFWLSHKRDSPWGRHFPQKYRRFTHAGAFVPFSGEALGFAEIFGVMRSARASRASTDNSRSSPVCLDAARFRHMCAWT